MTAQRRPRRDPLETALEVALQPGRFIAWRSGWEFVSSLEEIAGQLEKLVRTDPGRAVRLYETFLAGCYEKAEELDDSGANFGTFVVSLYCGWIKARQAAKSNPDETARLMNKNTLAAFEREARTRFDAKDAAQQASGHGPQRDPAGALPRWSRVLRAIYAQQRDVPAYVALCERTQLSAQDCLVVATMLKTRHQRDEALAWVDRGLAVEKQHPYGSIVGHHLKKLNRELLTQLGRRRDALQDACAEFCRNPNTFSYEELMRLVPRAERAAWRAKAMDAAERADLGSLIDLWLKCREIERLVARLRTATEAEIEDLSHYRTEPAARRLGKSHPDVAAKVYRALGMRILNAKKSKYYDAAVSHFENAKRCYERSGLHREWTALVADVRGAHHRKAGFMADFERLVAGHGPGAAPSFLERARSRWSAPGKP